MNNMVTFAVCGCGIRGLEAYAAYQKHHPEEMKLVAGADIRPERLKLLQTEYQVPESKCFSSSDELLDQPKLADVMIIATQDKQHAAEALRALEKGYHLLLEKPVSPDLQECIALQKKAHETNRAVIVCHVLRYTSFYKTIHDLICNGAIGKLESVDAVENVAYWHYCHSFVRGNWRRESSASPMILAKSCHDMDILRWLIGEKCLRVSSFGSLDHFTEQNAPEGAARRCMDGCRQKEDCPFDAEKIYIENKQSGFLHIGPQWPCTVLDSFPTKESLYEAIITGPYGRCVYHCDNDVVDHQVVAMEFKNNITATFTMSAFTEDCHRTIKIMGTRGEIEGDMEECILRIRRFGKTEEIINLKESLPSTGTEENFAGHGGGDLRMMSAVCRLISSGEHEALTSIDVSIESHIMALAAEASRRTNGRVIELETFS
ncbi:Gfo/Idh/MocA family protein [Hungatella sp. SB206]|uniref:Gfo/Idh/MocA family protein n=1 Tax=Hungatella sp. SB206 TaxID=2937758 RepID=UPI003DA80F0E